MPKFVFERQYLVPMYQHIVVEAETLEAACKKASATISTGTPRRWIAKALGATTLTTAKVIPEGYDVDPAAALIVANRAPRPPAGHAQSRPLPLRERGRDRPAARDPRQIYRRRITAHAPSAAVEGARGVGAVRPSRRAGSSKNRPAVPAWPMSDSVRPEGLASAEFNPCTRSHQYGLSPLHAEACGG